MVPLLLLAAGIQSAREPLPPVGHYGDRIEILRDIPFGDAPHQKLDLFRPREGGPHPVVVCYFGGGFIKGSRRSMERVGAALAARGMAAAAAEYFLARPKDGVRAWPRNLHDAKRAVRFVRARARPLGLDPDRMAVLGSSAGSYLAMMVAFTSDVRELDGEGWLDRPSSVRAVVNIAGVCDRRESLGTGTRNLLGEGYEKNADLRALASPVLHVDGDAPPVYTLHGTEDDNVSPESARQLDAALRKAGVEHRLHWVEGAGHQPMHRAAMDSIAAWLRGRLRP